MTHLTKIAITALVLVIMRPNLSFAAIAGMPCEKSEVGKTEMDDNKKNIIGCLITDDGTSQIWKNFGGNYRKYSLACDDWKSSGFNSEDDCIMDGRWHLVYSHDKDGKATFGDFDSFYTYVKAGADIKSGDEEGIHYCQEVVITNPVVTCLDSSRIAGNVIDNSGSYQANDGKIGIGAAARRVDGARITAKISPQTQGSDALKINTQLRDKHSMDWYVRF